MDFSADCTILTAMISRVQSYEKLQKNFPAVLCHLEYDTLNYEYAYLWIYECSRSQIQAHGVRSGPLVHNQKIYL